MNIELTIKNYRCFSDEKPARITIRSGFTAFLGINNSGKSSLLKFFFEFRNLFKLLSSTDSAGSSGDRKWTALVVCLNGSRQNFGFPAQITDIEEVFCNTNTRDIEIQLQFEDEAQSKLPHMIYKLVVTVPRGTSSWDCKMYLDNVEVTPGDLHFRENNLYRGDAIVTDLSPVLQGCKVLGNMFYIGSFRNTINVGSANNYYDIPVGQAFITQWNAWKTGDSIKQRMIADQVQTDIAKIFEYSRLEISASPDGQRLIMMIDGKSYKISELGSGLTQFFLVLASAAMRDQPSSFILIDEPEINLHPSLQLDFLTRLTSYAHLGILFATHSFGLARASADRIYSVLRGSDALSEITDYESTPRLAELLGELSFAGYKELGFDKILLVEGSTEVKTIQQFLRWYKKEHQIVLLPMGGDQMINPEAEVQLEEIKRITPNVFALIDSERSAPGEELSTRRAKFKNLCDNAGIQCHVLELRATENYFPDYAIKKIKGDGYRALQPYEPFKSTPSFCKWAKSENWQIAREMVPEDLDNTDFGGFLKSL